MGELALRWILAGAATLVSGWTGVPRFETTWPTALIWAVSVSLLLRRDRTNPGYSGMIAALDGIALCVLASSAGVLEAIGWLAVVPVAVAALRYGSKPLASGSLVAGGLLAANQAFGGGSLTAATLGQLVGIYVVSWCVGARAAVQAPSEHVGPTDPLGDPDNMLALRESFRQLKTLYRQLEWQSRRDHNAARLLETRFGDDRDMAERLGAQVKELVGADRVVLYSTLADGSGFVATDVDGHLPIDSNDAIGRIRHAADREIVRSLGSGFANVPLTHAGKVVGLCVYAASQGVDDVRIACEELAPILGELLVEAHAKASDATERELARLRIDLAIASRGAVGPEAAAERFAARVAEIFGLMHVSIQANGRVLASVGRDLGEPEWMASTELHAFVASEHPVIGRVEATRLRLGSLCIVSSGELVGCFASSSDGAIDSSACQSMRTLLTDLGWSIAFQDRQSGLLDANAFRARMSTPGALVLLEITERSERSRHSIADVTSRLRERALTLAAPGCGVYMRPDGDVVVHLPGTSLASAAEWGQRVITQLHGTRARTASLWPRVEAAVPTSDELETMLGRSNV